MRETSRETDNIIPWISMARLYTRERHIPVLLDLSGAVHEAELMSAYIEVGWAKMFASGRFNFCKGNIHSEMYVGQS
jgi:hypothetical protein